MTETMMKKRLASIAKRRRQRGITLVEMLVVLAIIALVSAIVVINVLPILDKANADKAQIDINNLENAIEQFRLDVAAYPTSEQGLEALVRAPADLRNVVRYRPGGYLRRGVPLDPWGNPYQYRFPSERGGVFDLYSMGADGQPGGEGLDADIGNWTSE